MRKTVAAATMAASLTIGGAAGVALFTPTLSGAQTDGTTESTDDTRETRARERLGAVLAPLVDEGTITDAQSGAVIDSLVAAGPMHEGRHGFGLRGDIAEDVSEVLGLSTEEIRSQLADGQSLADIAATQGVDTQRVVDAIVGSLQERLDAAVEAGRLTEDEAAEKAEDVAEHASDLVERTFDGHGPRGPGRGMRHGGFGPGTTDS